MAPSFVSHNTSQNDTKHLLSTTNDNPAKRKRKSSGTTIVQYRRSGQYYGYSSSKDRECQSAPKRYIARQTTEQEKPSPGLVAAAANLTFGECIEIEKVLNKYGMGKISSVECLATEDFNDRQRAFLKESMQEGFPIRGTQRIREKLSKIITMMFLSCIYDDELQDFDGEICEDKSKTEAPCDEETKKDTNTANTSLVKALRDLYHFGRTPSSDKISSFATEASVDTLASEDDEELRETKRLRRADSNELRCVVTDESCESTTTNDTDSDSCSEDDGFCYSGLKASDYYSADLVVEWDSSCNFDNRQGTI